MMFSPHAYGVSPGVFYFSGEQELNTIGRSLQMYKVCIPLTAPLVASRRKLVGSQQSSVGSPQQLATGNWQLLWWVERPN
jgi:hypothetical protein